VLVIPVKIARGRRAALRAEREDRAR